MKVAGGKTVLGRTHQEKIAAVDNRRAEHAALGLDRRIGRQVETPLHSAVGEVQRDHGGIQIGGVN